jgi:antitoxin component YwqK of YwqJK toxin-antitoxin module
MLDKKILSDGEEVQELCGNLLTYFYANGEVKAQGGYESDQKEGEWKFFRETGQLWQVGNFKSGKKHGLWVRFDKNGELEYKVKFDQGKIFVKQ